MLTKTTLLNNENIVIYIDMCTGIYDARRCVYGHTLGDCDPANAFCIGSTSEIPGSKGATCA